jgi:hypothetical protein
MIDYGEHHFSDLCRDGRVALEISTLEDKRAAAVRQFWLRLAIGTALAIAIAWSMFTEELMGIGLFLAIAVFVGGIVLAALPLGKAGKSLKLPTLETLAEKGGLTYMENGFDPPVYPDARKALFGNWLSSQSFTDLFHGMDEEGKRFALYEGHLTRKSGKSTVTVFSGQMYAFQRRARSGGEIVIVPDRGLFNFFKPLSGMERVRFESDPEFEKKFEVYAFQAHEALSLIGSDVRRKLLDLRQTGRVFGYVGPEDVFIAATAKNKFEAGSMFRSTGGQERVRRMFDEVCESLGQLRALKGALG